MQSLRFALLPGFTFWSLNLNLFLDFIQVCLFYFFLALSDFPWFFN